MHPLRTRVVGHRKSSIVSSSSLLRGVFCIFANRDLDPVATPLAPEAEGRGGVCGLDGPAPAPTLGAGELLADRLPASGRLIFNMIRLAGTAGATGSCSRSDSRTDACLLGLAVDIVLDDDEDIGSSSSGKRLSNVGPRRARLAGGSAGGGDRLSDADLSLTELSKSESDDELKRGLTRDSVPSGRGRFVWSGVRPADGEASVCRLGGGGGGDREVSSSSSSSDSPELGAER